MSQTTAVAKYYKNNKEKILIYRKAYNKKNKVSIRIKTIARRKNNPIKNMLRIAKSRAKEKQLDFNISVSDFSELPTHCPVLGIPLIYYNIGKRCDNSASLDRFDNTKGYVKGNTKIISLRANTLKSNGTLEEFKKIVKYLTHADLVRLINETEDDK